MAEKEVTGRTHKNINNPDTTISAQPMASSEHLTQLYLAERERAENDVKNYKERLKLLFRHVRV